MSVDPEPLSLAIKNIFITIFFPKKISYQTIHPPLDCRLPLTSGIKSTDLSCASKSLITIWLPNLKGRIIKRLFSMAKTMVIWRVVCVSILSLLIRKYGTPSKMVLLKLLWSMWMVCVCARVCKWEKNRNIILRKFYKFLEFLNNMCRPQIVHVDV